MDMWPVGVKAPAVSYGVVLKDSRLGNEINNVEAKTIDTFVVPETHYVGKLGSDVWVVPVEVRLRGVKEMKVPLMKCGNPFPCASAKL